MTPPLCRRLALTHGNVSAQSFGWPGHRQSARDACREVHRRAPWILRAEPARWGAILVSEQTRQFYAWRNIPELFLPHVFGTFRAALEEHLPLRLVNDWDLNPEQLAKYQVLVLPNAAALSDAQLDAVRGFVRNGGGLVATGETSLCDEWGEPRGDFALADLFGVSFRGRPQSAAARQPLDENFARHLDETYWQQRVGLATLTWDDHPITRDARLTELVPHRSVIFRGPQVLVTDPPQSAEIAWGLQPEGQGTVSPAAVARQFGRGKVVYLAAALDAALWSDSYPYQRRLLARAIEWSAPAPPPVRVEAPLCVQTTFFEQTPADAPRLRIIHLFNNLNTTAHHGHPAADVPLREETIPVPSIRAVFLTDPPHSCRLEPEGIDIPLKPSDAAPGAVAAELPPLHIHSMLVAEY